MRSLLRSTSMVPIALLLSATSALAQVQAGDRELSVGGVAVSGIGKEKHSFEELQIGFEYFVSRRWSWRLELGLEHMSDGAHASTETEIGSGIEWNLGSPDAKNAPFVGLEVQHIFDGPVQVSAVSPYVGLRAFMSRSTSFDIAVNYELSHDDGHFSSGAMVHLGFSYYFRKDPRR